MRRSGMPMFDWEKYPVEAWTLREVVERGALVFECAQCRRLSEADVLALIERHGADSFVAKVQERMCVPGAAAAGPEPWRS